MLFRPLALLTVSLLILAGCSDNMVSDGGQFSPPSQTTGKFRHADRVADSGIAGKDSGTLDLIINIDKQGVIERYRVLERYKLLERYAVVERYEYNDVIGGYAISVEDSTGLANYDDFLASLDADPDILWYEPDFSMLNPTPFNADNESGQVIPWSVAAIGGMSSWTASGDGSGSVDVDLYVMDTGVEHPDINVTESVDFRVGGTADPSDVDGHGTHIAAIAAAVDDSDGLVGIAPGARVHNLKVLNDDGRTDVSVVLAAVEYVTAQKLANPSMPIVVNMSIGENMGNDLRTALDDAVQQSAAAGVTYVVAAGNQGMNASFMTPAKVDEVITVGSYSILGLFSPFSNHGPKVDLLAPGEGIVSLAPSASGQVIPTAMSGTSMATAHVAGAAALFLAQNPTATPAQVQAYLIDTAEDFVIGAPSNTTSKSVWVGQQPMGSSVLMVVTDGKKPTTAEKRKRAVLEGMGFSVDYISEDASSADFETSAAGHDVMYMGETVSALEVASKIRALGIGVVVEGMNLLAEAGIASTGNLIVGNPGFLMYRNHYVTAPFEDYTEYQLFTSDQPQTRAAGFISSGIEAHGTWSGSFSNTPALSTLEPGDALYDGTSAAGRRVALPWGSFSTLYPFDVDALSPSGLQLLERSLQWASGRMNTGASSTNAALEEVRLTSSETSVMDTFDSMDFRGDDGSQNWIGPWIESDTNPGPNYGQVLTKADPLCGAGHCLRIWAKNGTPSAARFADLSGATSATLSFDVARSGMRKDNTYLEVTSNGLSWTRLKSFGTGTDSAPTAEVHDISAFASPNTGIRFVVDGRGSKDSFLFIDNVKITF